MHDVPHLHGVALGDDQGIEPFGLRHDAEVRGIAGRVGLLVGDDLRRPVARVPAGLARAHDPQVALVGGIARAWLHCRSSCLQLGTGVLRSAHRYLAGRVPGRVGGHICSGAERGLRAAIFVMMEDKLHMDARAHRLVIVVHGSHAELRHVACMHRVAYRRHIDAEGAVGRQEAAAAGDLAVSGIGYAGLHRVVEIGMRLALGVDVRGHLDDQRAVRVELAGLLGFFIPCIVVRVAGVRVGAVGVARGVVFVLAPPVVTLVVDAILHRRIRHRLAKEVARVDGDRHGRAFQHALQVRRHLHAILGLAVVFHVEAAGDLVVLPVADADGVIT